MMDLESAIQHCREQVQEQAKKGCYSCAEEHHQLAEWLKELKAYKEQSGDAISKEQLIRELNAQMAVGAITREVALDMIIHLLPVTPQQRSGRWIVTDDDFVYCSECEDSYYPRPIDASWRYCPHCGAKMEV